MSTSTHHTPAGASGIARLVSLAARISARRPKLVITLWLALIAGCVIGGGLVGTRTLSGADSGSGESGRAVLQMQHAGLLNSFSESLIVKSKSAARTDHAAVLLAERVRRARYVVSISSPASDRSLSRDRGRAALIEVTLRSGPDQQTDRVVPLERVVSATAREEPGVYIGEAGDGSGARAVNNTVSTGLGHAEMIALPITLLILVAAFGALVAAVVPLLLGLTSVAAAMGALGLVSQIAPNGSTTSSVVVLIGLAVGVDYSLFYIRRERAERRAGAGPEAALAASAQTVGRAILIAGATVIIGLVGLLVAGNAVFVSMALGAILVVAIAVLGSLTVLPATLALLGDRIDRGRVWRRGSSGRRPTSGEMARTPKRGIPTWGRLAGSVTTRPRLSLLVALALLATLAVPLLSIRLGNPGSADLPPDNPTVVAQRAIDRAFPGCDRHSAARGVGASARHHDRQDAACATRTRGPEGDRRRQRAGDHCGGARRGHGGRRHPRSNWR